jgi:hypothetical protein
VIWGLLGAALVLHVLFAFRYRVDSDEPQHLHVVWGWAHGLLQYRDVFDNHAPLFHMLMAPLVWCLGDRADLLILMRLAMIPLIAGGIACVWAMGRAVFGSRVGAWAATLAALLPPLFLGEGEFRTDTLWTTCWLATLAILCGPKLTFRRGLLAGVALGAACSVSMKTTYLVLGLAGAGLLTAAMSARFFSQLWVAAIPQLWVATIPQLWVAAIPQLWVAAIPGRHLRGGRPGLAAAQSLQGLGRFLSAMFLGWLLLPGVLVAFFWIKGAGGDMYYGVIGHNMIPLERSVSWPLTALLGLTCIGLMCAVGSKVLKAGTPESARLRQVFVVLLGGTTAASLLLWPKITPQDYLPLYPIWIVLAVALIARVWAPVGRGVAGRLTQGAFSPLVLVILAVAGLLVTAGNLDGEGGPDLHVPLWQDVLRLTDPGQAVMDLKGELIFRPRAYRYIVETLTGQMFQRGTLPAEDIKKSMIARGACVTSKAFHRLPEQTREFIQRNYLPVGRLLAVGKTLRANDSGVVDFEVVIGTRYAILTPCGPARGQLDGQTYAGPVRLAQGPHRYLPAKGEEKLALIWAQAVERGYYPTGFSGSPN